MINIDNLSINILIRYTGKYAMELVLKFLFVNMKRMYGLFNNTCIVLKII